MLGTSAFSTGMELSATTGMARENQSKLEDAPFRLTNSVFVGGTDYSFETELPP